MQFRFRSPIGEELELEDSGSIVDLVLHKGADFWNVGSGDAAVEIGPTDAPEMLGLYFDRKDRFQLRHLVPGEYPAIAIAPSAIGQDTVINVGGTPLKLEGNTLVSREDAAAIVRHYCETGKKHPDYDWRQ